MSRFFQASARPYPKFSHSLWRGCQFAYRAGWAKGFFGTTDAGIDDINRKRAAITSPTTTNYGTIDAGRVIKNGSTNDDYQWSEVLSRYSQPNHRVTLAMLVRRNSGVSGNEHRGIFGKGNTTGDYVSDLNVDSYTGGGLIKYSFQVRNPAGGNIQVYSTTLSVTTRTDMVVGLYDGANVEIYVNGKREGQSAYAGLMVQNSTPVNFYRIKDVAANLDVNIAMAAMWNRNLPKQEIAELNTDPYTMWRTELHNEFMFGPGMIFGNGGVIENDCCKCPAWMTGPLASQPIF